ncbi:zinc finger protein 687b-like [Zerene cesonia]|uniref:zinc finger protein 687b-like n=1 Tax=Zerene cesonia TaxID=33412 RepID=UPI0018E59668|nr:zinc finger protein 687b-like [Zerene cesonia]XP_038208055.1 zinc finger protein 687b-like [Zerene cesonia]
MAIATDMVSDRINIKNILFTKAMPNYKIPVPTDGHKLYSCIDCSDKFIFESSYKVHIGRKSLQITYLCRYCSKLNVFYNRCQFLAHIRSHTIKTATINLSDLKVEPLLFISSEIATTSKSVAVNPVKTFPNIYCFECKKDITVTRNKEKDRVTHYMEHANRVFTCPVCLFTLPSVCALNAHIRLHLKSPPYICPECGMNLSNRICIYPYNHDCEGFKMMRVTSRIKCFKSNCQLLHPNNFVSHMRLSHLNKIFKCPHCSLAGYNENAVLKHVMRCCDKTKYPTYYECQQCPGIFLGVNQINKHLDIHLSSIHKTQQMYPCWNCGVISNDVHGLLKHYIYKHRSTHNRSLSVILSKITLKTCHKCSKTTHQWIDGHFDTEPYKCSYCSLESLSEESSSAGHRTDVFQIVCHLCRVKVNENWEEIKAHFKEFHNHIKCLDLKVSLTKMNLKEIQKKVNRPKRFKSNKIFKRNQKNKIKIHMDRKSPPTLMQVEQNTPNYCKECQYQTEDAKTFHVHILSHRDPSMAYQCMECGLCFAVKPSFSTHLLLDHKITDVNEYVVKNNCFNKDALEKYHIKSDALEDKPLEENQCNICREKFTDPHSLEKHFRVHGMAFLKKNTQKVISP